MAPDRPLAPGGTVRLIRPLLDVGRQAVTDYLREGRIPFREDETNRTPAWTRNRVRNRILPLLSRDVHPGAARALARFAAQAADAHRWVECCADAAARRGRIRSTSRGGTARIDVAAGLPPAVRTEIWRRALDRLGGGMPAFPEIDAFEEVLAGRADSASLRGGTIRVRRSRGDLKWIVRRGGARSRRPARG
jgi:tRNA(Ile)-lysidine synthase